MRIGKSTSMDLDRNMEIYAHAGKFMAEHGNPHPCGPTNWPSEGMIRRFIQQE